MKEKCNFFPKYLINLIYAALFSVFGFFMSRTLGMSLVGNIVRGLIGNMFLLDFIFIAALAFQFLITGYRDRERGRVSVGQFIAGGIPAWLLFMLYDAFDAFIRKMSMPATGSSFLALALCTGSSSDIFEEEELTVILQGPFLKYFILCALIHIIGIGLLSYGFYLLGIRQREKEREALLNGVELFTPSRLHLFKVAPYIPLVNYLPFFSWIWQYYKASERKLKRCIPRFLFFVVLQIAFRGIRYGVYQLNQGNFLNIALYILLVYLYGLIVSFIIYRDELYHHRIVDGEEK